MSVLIVTSVSANIAEMAALTVPNKAEYCLRHGYSLLVENMPYELVVAKVSRWARHFEQFDIVWTLDADAVITNMGPAIHGLDCLGPHVTVCEENIVDWNYVNCGSVVWRDTPVTLDVMASIDADEPRWRTFPCIWQTWMGIVAQKRPDAIKVAPTRSFNSVAWNHPGGSATYSPGSHWQPGDLVYHPCGMFPHEAKLDAVRDAMTKVVR